MLFMIKRYGASSSDGFFFKLHLLLSDDVTFAIIFAFHVNILMGKIFIVICKMEQFVLNLVFYF